MKTLIILLLLSPASFCQSHFDGTWVFIAPLQQKPAVYSLAKGVFRCSGCMANAEVKADGYDHKVAEAAYWDTLNVQMVDAHTVEIIAKKAGKTMLTEVLCDFSRWKYADPIGERHDRSRGGHD